MKLVPLNDNVVVSRDEPEKSTKSGIFLPDSAVKKTARGIVLAVGPGALNDKGTRTPLDIMEGDHIIFHDYAGHEVRLPDGEIVLVMPEKQILGTVIN